MSTEATKYNLNYKNVPEMINMYMAMLVNKHI